MIYEGSLIFTNGNLPVGRYSFCKSITNKADFEVVFKKLCHFLKLLKTGMMHYGNYI